MEANCCFVPQPCPNCGRCPCCGRGGNQFVVPYQTPYYPPYPQPVWIGGYVQPSTTGMPLPLPSFTVTC